LNLVNSCGHNAREAEAQETRFNFMMKHDMKNTASYYTYLSILDSISREERERRGKEEGKKRGKEERERENK